MMVKNMEVGGLIIGLLFGGGLGYLLARRGDASINQLSAAVYQLGALDFDLRGVMRRLVHLLERQTSAQVVELVVKDDNSDQIWVENNQSRQSSRQAVKFASDDLERIDAFLAMKQRQVLITAKLKVVEPEIYKILVSYDVDVLVALKSRSSVIGYVCLKNSPKTLPNPAVLEQIVTANDGIVVALLSAQSRDNLAEANSQLEQRIKAATSELEQSNQQLRRLDEAKDEFVAMTSHQLRTPLTSVKGYISLLLEGDAGKLTDEQQQLLNEAFYASQTMVNIVNDFLSVSRLQTGRFVIDREILDIEDLIQAEVNNLQKTAANYDLRLKFKSEPKIPTKLNVDSNKIRQAVGNMIDNAIYYSLPGGAITVSLAQVDGQLRVAVSDQGVGVPEAERDKLFTKFYRASTGKRRRPDGTGIGLYLVKEIVEAHNGRVFYKPLKQGSEFGFTLPINKQLNPGIFIEQK